MARRSTASKKVTDLSSNSKIKKGLAKARKDSKSVENQFFETKAPNYHLIDSPNQELAAGVKRVSALVGYTDDQVTALKADYDEQIAFLSSQVGSLSATHSDLLAKTLDLRSDLETFKASTARWVMALSVVAGMALGLAIWA